MANEPTPVPFGDLTSRDQGMTHVEGRPSRLRLVKHEPVLLSSLMNKLPKRLELTECRDVYERLAKVPLYGFTVEGSENDEFFVVGPRLSARDVNALLYFSAPDRDIFKLDTDDIINDWTSLYNNPDYKARLTAHRTMPGWGQYEASRELILGVLQRNYPNRYSNQFVQADPDDVVIPVMHWKKDVEGNRVLSLDPLDEEMRTRLAEQLPDYVSDPSRLDVGMGTIFLSAYSPDQTNWPKRSGYQEEKAPLTQTIGSTQVLAYAIRRVTEQQRKPGSVPDDQDIQQSPILASLDTYFTTGETIVIPEILEPQRAEPDMDVTGHTESLLILSDLESTIVDYEYNPVLSQNYYQENFVNQEPLSGVTTVFIGNNKYEITESNPQINKSFEQENKY